MIPSYLINLDRAGDRLSAMEKTFGAAGVAFTRFPGVDAKAFPPDVLTAFFDARPRFSAERLAGDAGTFLSHLLLWETIASGADPLVAVFEDDVHLAADLARLLSDPSWLPADADIVKLESNNKMVLRAGRRIPAAPSRSIYRAESGSWGTAGYVIAKTAAQRLLTMPVELHTHIDWYLFKPTRSPVSASLRRYQVVPAVCIQDMLLNGADATMKSSVADGLRQVRRRERRSLLSYILPWRKRPVPFRP